MANEYRFSALAVEVVRSGAANQPARISALAVEVVRSISGTATISRRRQTISVN